MKILPKTLLPFVWHFIKPQWGRFLVLTISMLAWSVQESLFPYFIKLIMDQIVANANEKSKIFVALAPTLMIGVLLWLCIELFFRVYDFLFAVVFPKFKAEVRTALFEYSQQHSHQFFSDNFAGSIASKISRMPEAIEKILRILLTVIFPVVLAFMIRQFTNEVQLS